MKTYIATFSLDGDSIEEPIFHANTIKEVKKLAQFYKRYNIEGRCNTSVRLMK